jgi:hypothetical protein
MMVKGEWKRDGDQEEETASQTEERTLSDPSHISSRSEHWVLRSKGLKGLKGLGFRTCHFYLPSSFPFSFSSLLAVEVGKEQAPKHLPIDGFILAQSLSNRGKGKNSRQEKYTKSTKLTLNISNNVHITLWNRWYPYNTPTALLRR